MIDKITAENVASVSVLYSLPQFTRVFTYQNGSYNNCLHNYEIKFPLVVYRYQFQHIGTFVSIIM